MMIAQVALCAAAAQFGLHRLVQSFLDPRMNMTWRPSSIMVRAPMAVACQVSTVAVPDSLLKRALRHCSFIAAPAVM